MIDFDLSNGIYFSFFVIDKSRMNQPILNRFQLNLKCVLGYILCIILLSLYTYIMHIRTHSHMKTRVFISSANVCTHLRLLYSTHPLRINILIMQYLQYSHAYMSIHKCNHTIARLFQIWRTWLLIQI